jgi:hypothetical protein
MKADVEATGTPVTTTQTTSKRFKGQMAVGLTLCIVAAVMWFARVPAQSLLPAILFLLGGGLYLSARVRGWWHHG